MKEETKLTKDNLLTILHESTHDKENPLYEAMFAYNNEPNSLGGVVDKVKESESKCFLVELTTKNHKKLAIIEEK
jgi:hypothetical protein